MIIKKFTGKTEAEATEAAKKELGNGLVIMNVREVKKKGLFSFLSPKHFPTGRWNSVLHSRYLLFHTSVLL